MNYRRLGKTGLYISEISLGTWQVGGRWGDAFSHTNAEKILNHAIDHGVNFIDTADVYSDGESEKVVGNVVKSRTEKVYVATKCGRKLSPHTNSAYTPDVLRKFVEDSLINTGLERLDLIQLHCPPHEVYYRPEIFELFDRLQQEGKIANLGVSVEKVEEALKAIEFPNVTTIQIIFNMFRQRPSELCFREAQRKDVGIIVRVPLASGMLTGNYHKDMTFAAGDHRNFNRSGAAFDKGETFAGIDFNLGLQAVEELKKVFPNKGLALIALRWILMFKEISCIIPGASRVDQMEANLRAMDLPAIPNEELQKIQDIYNHLIKKQVHHLW